MITHPQVAFAEAVSALSGRFAAASGERWDADRCSSEAEKYWREALRRGWKFGDAGALVTSSQPSAADVLADARQRLARGEVPDDDARQERLAAVKAAIVRPEPMTTESTGPAEEA
jgi:hypothetical protein